MAMRCKHVLAVMALLVAATPVMAQEDIRASNPEPAKATQHAAPKKIIRRHAKIASVKPARVKRAVAAKMVKTPLPPPAPKREVAKAEPTPLPPPKPDAAKVEAKTPLPQPKPEVAKLEPTAPLPPPKPEAGKVDEKTPLPVPRPAAAKAEPEKPPAKPDPAKTAAKPEPAAPAVAAIVPDERSRIQAALAWAGDLSNDAKGEEPLTTAIKSYQKRNKAKTTGELTPDQRAALSEPRRACTRANSAGA